MLFWLVNSLFILFAVLNINDPDWFLWVPTYLLVVAGAVSYEKKLINKKGMNVLLFFLLFVFVFSFFCFSVFYPKQYAAIGVATNKQY